MTASRVPGRPCPRCRGRVRIRRTTRNVPPCERPGRVDHTRSAKSGSASVGLDGAVDLTHQVARSWSRPATVPRAARKPSWIHRTRANARGVLEDHPPRVRHRDRVVGADLDGHVGLAPCVVEAVGAERRQRAHQATRAPVDEPRRTDPRAEPERHRQPRRVGRQLGLGVGQGRESRVSREASSLSSLIIRATSSRRRPSAEVEADQAEPCRRRGGDPGLVRAVEGHRLVAGRGPGRGRGRGARRPWSGAARRPRRTNRRRRPRGRRRRSAAAGGGPSVRGSPPITCRPRSSRPSRPCRTCRCRRCPGSPPRRR